MTDNFEKKVAVDGPVESGGTLHVAVMGVNRIGKRRDLPRHRLLGCCPAIVVLTSLRLAPILQRWSRR